MERTLLFLWAGQYVDLRAERGFDLNSVLIWTSGAYWSRGSQQQWEITYTGVEVALIQETEERQISFSLFLPFSHSSPLSTSSKRDENKYIKYIFLFLRCLC